MSMLEPIIGKCRELAVRKNQAPDLVRNQGVLFSRFITPEGMVENEAWVFSESTIIRFSKIGAIDFPLDTPFYSYADNAFTKNVSSYENVEDLRRTFATKAKGHWDAISATAQNQSHGYLATLESQAFLIPVVNLLNRLTKAFEPTDPHMVRVDKERIMMQRIGRSRTIMKNNPGLIFEGELILEFDGSSGTFFNIHPAFKDIKFVPAENSNIRGEYQHGRRYRTVPNITIDKKLIVDNGFCLIDVRDEYFKGIEFLFHELHSGAFNPESEKDVIDASRYGVDSMYRYSYISPLPSGGLSFQPYHLETPTMYYMLRLFEGYDFVYAGVFKTTRVRPILFVADSSDAGLPCIECLFGPLLPDNRGYIL